MISRRKFLTALGAICVVPTALLSESKANAKQLISNNAKIWGQKTLVQQDSNIALRMILKTIKDDITQYIDTVLLFEPDTEETNNKTVKDLEKYLSRYKTNKVLYDYKVTCTNIRNETIINVFIQTNPNTEIININYRVVKEDKIYV